MGKICIVLLGIILFSLVSGLDSITEVGHYGGDVLGETPTPSNSFAYEEEKLSPEEEICELMKGCWEDKDCYPYGYRVEETYCGWTIKKRGGVWKVDKRIFVQQKDVIEQCNNSFECKSNFCFNDKCIDTLKIIDDEIVRINKTDLEELKNVVDNAEDSMKKNQNQETSEFFLSSILNSLKKIFGW